MNDDEKRENERLIPAQNLSEWRSMFCSLFAAPRSTHPQAVRNQLMRLLDPGSKYLTVETMVGNSKSLRSYVYDPPSLFVQNSR